MKFKIASVFFFLLSCTCLHAGSLRLFNDTKYEMEVFIKGNDGSDLGQVTVEPGATVNWSDTFGQAGYSGSSSFQMNKSNKSKTPYSVHWYIKKIEEEYAACYDIVTGTTVTAKTCRKSKK